MTTQAGGAWKTIYRMAIHEEDKTMYRVRDVYAIYGDRPDSAAYSTVLHGWVLNTTAQDWSHKSF